MRIAISPCPNDTFLFAALLQGKVEAPSEYEVDFLDIEQLNHLVAKGESGLIKMSFAQYFQVEKQYELLDVGSALGFGCGPLLVGGQDSQLIPQTKVYIPGYKTTANALLGFLHPGLQNKKELLFSDILDRLKLESNSLGVLIHETRFTYHNYGLVCHKDLGKEYEDKTGFPIPLGGLVISRDHISQKEEWEAALRESLEYAWRNMEETLDFCSRYAQEMNREVMKSHVDLYVNDFTRDLGEKGHAAIAKLRELSINCRT